MMVCDKQEWFKFKHISAIFACSDKELRKNKTIQYTTNVYNLENGLKSLVVDLISNRPKCGTKNFKILHETLDYTLEKNFNNFLTEHGIGRILHPDYFTFYSPDYFIVSA